MIRNVVKKGVGNYNDLLHDFYDLVDTDNLKIYD